MKEKNVLGECSGGVVQGRGRAALLGLVLMAVCGVGPSHALTDEEIYRNFRFNFTNPGARSLGLGGAFISLADDATAALANPAGMSNLTRPQIFFEARARNFDGTTLSNEFGTDMDIADLTLLAETSTTSDTSPSFISYVYPWSRLSLGVSVHEVLDNESQVSASHRIVDQLTGIYLRSDGRITAQVRNWNLSLGWRLHERVRIGGTITMSQLSVDSLVTNDWENPDDESGPPETQLVPIETFRTWSDGSDSDMTYSVGLLWNVVDQVTVGVVYRDGPDFSVDETVEENSNLCVFMSCSGTSLPNWWEISEQVRSNQGGRTTAVANEFHVPSAIGIGISWRPVPRLTLAVDAVETRYSELGDGFVGRLNVLTIGLDADEAELIADDQTNVHVGIEYLLENPVGKSRMAFRVGYRQDKDSRLRQETSRLPTFPLPPGSPPTPIGPMTPFPEGDDFNHYAAGIGVVFGNALQLDAAVDVFEEGVEAVVSMTYRFEGR